MSEKSNPLTAGVIVTALSVPAPKVKKAIADPKIKLTGKMEACS